MAQSRLVKDYKTFGDLSVQQILAKSSNVGSYKIALELGPDQVLRTTSRAFGFGAKTNILMAGESAGVVSNTGNPTDFSRISFGYARECDTLAGCLCLLRDCQWRSADGATAVEVGDGGQWARQLIPSTRRKSEG